MWKIFVSAAAVTGAPPPAARSSSGPAGGADGMNLLVITLDTTRADALGLYGNPDGSRPISTGWGGRGWSSKDATPRHRYKDKFYPFLAPGDRKAADRRAAEIRALRGGR